MAKIVFSQEEMEEVDRLCAELDPETHHLTAEWAAQINPKISKTILDYMRAAIRGEMIAGLIARATGDALILQNVAEPAAVRGMLSEDFWERYREGSVYRHSQWQYNLGRVGDEEIRFFWALAEAFGDGTNKVRMGHPLVRSFHALLDVANDRMFGSFELDLDTITDEEDR